MFRTIILSLIAIGIWVIAFQNAGLIPPLDPKVRSVFVEGGSLKVSGTVDVFGPVEVSGSVAVDNEVDINIASVNGRSAKSYSGGLLGVHDP